MKKILMVLLFLMMTIGAFADYGEYFVDTDNMSGGQSLRIVYVDSNTDAKLIMILNLETGSLIYAITEDYVIYGYGDVTQAMYRFDNSSSVPTFVKLIDNGTTAIFQNSVSALWDGVRTSNILHVRIINDSTGGSENYSFELSGFQDILKGVNLM